MIRDARGNPGRHTPKNQPRLQLADVLRRRRMNLQQLLAEFGISTYDGLCIRCDRLGVVPPTAAEFAVVVPPTMSQVNNPQEGVVVVEAPPVITEATGHEIDAPVKAGLVFLQEPSGSTDRLPKKSRKKSDD